MNGQFGTSTFQIGANAGEAVQLTLGSMRSDTLAMGGFHYTSQNQLNKGWTVPEGGQTLTMSFNDENGKAQEITIEAKAGDDIEELATYINGQNDTVQASVDEKGQLQLFTAGDVVSSAVTFGGTLSAELAIGGAVFDTVNDLDLTSVGGSQRAIATLDAAMGFVDKERATLGAFQNRFDHAINNLNNINENVAASNSRIEDTDFAKETVEMMKAQILQQVSSTVLAQAKQAPDIALKLLG